LRAEIGAPKPDLAPIRLIRSIRSIRVDLSLWGPPGLAVARMSRTCENLPAPLF